MHRARWAGIAVLFALVFLNGACRSTATAFDRNQAASEDVATRGTQEPVPETGDGESESDGPRIVPPLGPWVAIMAPTDVGWQVWWDELTTSPPPGSRQNQGAPQEEPPRRDV